MKRQRIYGMIGAAMSIIPLFLALLLAAPEMAAFTALTVLVHEAGHILAACAFGTCCADMRAELGGLVIVSRGLKSYTGEIIMAAAGPAANFALCLLAAAADKLLGADKFTVLAGVSFALGAFNLLPALPLDGGRILFAALARISGPRLADIVLCVTSCAVILLSLLAGYVCAARFGAFAPAVVALWLLIRYCKEG